MHLAEEQFLLEEQILNTEKSLMYRAGTEDQPFPKENDRI
jgi:hypothetical protein